MGKTITSIVVSVLIVSWLSYTQGQAEADTTTNYYVVNDSNLAVIRIYPDVIYCVQFDPETKEFSPNLVIIATKDKGRIDLTMKNIGPLKVEKEVSTK